MVFRQLSDFVTRSRSRKSSRKSGTFSPRLELLEDRTLLSLTFNSFSIPTSSSVPQAITSDASGNLWFTEGGASRIGVVDVHDSNKVSDFALTSGGFPTGITLGPDGNIWFTESAGNRIGYINPSTHSVTELPTLPTANSQPSGITSAGGKLWFTELTNNAIGRITLKDGAAPEITEFSVATLHSFPNGITTDASGKVWFTESRANQVVRFDPATPDQITDPNNVPVSVNGWPEAITLGPDNNLWFIEATSNSIGRINAATKAVAHFDNNLTAHAFPQGYLQGMTKGPNGDLWFTETQTGKLGQISTTGTIREFDAPFAQPGGVIPPGPGQPGGGIIPPMPGQPVGITTAGGKVWFLESNNDKVTNFTPPSLAPTGTDVGFVHLALKDGGSFVSNSATGIIDIGLTPAAGQAFVPLLELNGTVRFTEQQVNLSGALSTAAGITGSPVNLFQGNCVLYTGWPIIPLTDNGTPAQFQIAGMPAKLTALGLGLNGLLYAATATMPGGGQLTLGGHLGADGIGGVFDVDRAYSTSGLMDMGIAGLKVKAENLDAVPLVQGGTQVYDPASDEFHLQGSVTLPDLYGARPNFAGSNFIRIHGGVITVVGASVPMYDFPILDNFGTPTKGWTGRQATLTIDTTAHTVSGACHVTGPNNQNIQMDIRIDEGRLALRDGVNTDIRIGGLIGTLYKAYFDNGQFQFSAGFAIPNSTTIFTAVPNGIQLTGGQTLVDVNFPLVGGLFEGGAFLRGSGMTLSYDGQALQLRGAAEVVNLFGTTVSANLSGNNYIQIKNGTVSLMGSMPLDNILLDGGAGGGLFGGPLPIYTLSNVSLTSDSKAPGGIRGSATMKYLLLSASVPVSFSLNGNDTIQFDMGAVNVTSPTTFNTVKNTAPVGSFSGATLRRIVGTLHGKTIDFAATMYVTYGDVPSSNVPPVELVFNVTAQGQSNPQTEGTLTVAGGLATAHVSNLLLRDFDSFGADLSDFSFLGGAITISGKLTVNRNGLVVNGTASVDTDAIESPNWDTSGLDGTGVSVAALPKKDWQGYLIVNGNSLTQAYYLLANHVAISDDPSAPTVPVGIYKPVLGVAKVVGLTDPISQTVTIAPNTPWNLLTAAWQNDVGSVPITLTDPKGKVYTEADFDNTTIKLLPGLATSTSDVVSLINPLPGKWTISIPDTTGLGTVTFHALHQTVSPLIHITKVDVSDSKVTVHYNVQNSDAAARISFYYGATQTDTGLLIKAGVAAANGAGTFVWNTSGVPSGQYYVKALVADGQTLISTDTSSQAVTIVNKAPVLAALADQTIVAGGSLSFTASASDSNRDVLLYSLGAGAPAGAVIDKFSGAFTWEPASNLATKDYPVTVTVTDSGTPALSASRTFTIHLRQQPVFKNASATTFTIGAPGSLLVFTDGVPKPTLSESPLDVLPKGVKFDAKTGKLFGTPTAGTRGVYPLHFTATSLGGSTVSQTVTLTVAQAPTFASAATTIFPVNVFGSFTVMANSFPNPSKLSEASTDKLPAGVTFNAATGVLSGTPAASAVGAYVLHFTAHSDFGKDAKQTFTLFVGQSPAFTSAGKTTFTVGAAGNFKLAATGFPKPTFTELKTDTLPKGVRFNAASGQLVGTPDAGTGGTYTLHFTAHNGAGQDITQTFTLTVNQPVAFSSPAKATFKVNTAGTFTLTATGFPTAITFRETSTDKLPAGVTFNAASGVLSGTATKAGTYTLHFFAHNGVGKDAAQTFVLNVVI